MSEKISVSNLHKSFGFINAVDGISFAVRTGEVLGFLGPNGAGKTTTMRMLTGYLPPDSGEIAICGTDILKEPVKAKSRMGYLPEGAPLYPEMTPRSLLGFVADTRGLSGSLKTERIADIAEKIHLREVWNQPIETLSKGYKRRVGLAQALLHDPEVLILDEPTDGLDPNQKLEVRELVREMAAEKAIIISTHILEEIRAICTRVLIIADGRIVCDKTPAELEAMSPYSGAVSITAARSRAADLAGVLGKVPGVSRVETAETNGNLTTLTAFADDNAAILSPVSEAVNSGSWEILEIRQERGGLEEVFRSLTVGEMGEGGRA